MEAEIALVKQQHAKLNLPVRDEPPERMPAEETVARRRLLRIEIDDFVRSLKAGDLVDFSIRVGRLVFVVSGTCAQFGCRPDFSDYTDAVVDMTTEAQHNLDRALQTGDWLGVKVATAKLQIIWYGIAANLGMPYAAIIEYLHQCYIAEKDVERWQIANLLRAAGLNVVDDPSNFPPVAAAANDEEKKS